MTEATAIKWAELSERERDAIVARRVFGWEVFGRSAQVPAQYAGRPGPFWAPPVGEPGFSEHWPIPNYTTDIAAAWAVIENLIARGWTPDLLSGYVAAWVVVVDAYQHNDDPVQWPVRAEADSAPEAICLAALRACGVPVEE